MPFLLSVSLLEASLLEPLLSRLLFLKFLYVPSMLLVNLFVLLYAFFSYFVKVMGIPLSSSSSSRLSTSLNPSIFSTGK